MIAAIARHDAGVHRRSFSRSAIWLTLSIAICQASAALIRLDAIGLVSDDRRHSAEPTVPVLTTHASRSMQQFEIPGAEQPLSINYGNEWAVSASGGEHS